MATDKDPNNPQEFKLNGNVRPHSISLGPTQPPKKERRIWVTTTKGSQLVGFNPDSPAEQQPIPCKYSVSGTRILADPYGEDYMWFASSEPGDPVFKFDVQEVTFTPQPLPGSTPAQDMVDIDISTKDGEDKLHRLAVTQATKKYVAIFDPANVSPISMTAAIDEDTTPWGITGIADPTSDPTNPKYHIYVAGQSSLNFNTTVNGIFSLSKDDNRWQKMSLPDSTARPFYVLVDSTKNALWVTTQGDQQQYLVWCLDLNPGGQWTVSPPLANPPYQMVDTGDYVWVAAGQYLYTIEKSNIENMQGIELPSNSSAMGLCVGSENTIWYTNQFKSWVGKYSIV